MRTFYIALIFVGCLSLVLGTQTETTPGPYPTRATPVNCGATDTTSTGCKTCAAGKCTEASPGYFIKAEQPVSCPRACATCNEDGTTCLTCVIPEAFTTNACTACKPGYAFDNGDATTGICIGQDNEAKYTCATDFFWDQSANSNRKCVSKTANCALGYSTDGTLTTASANCNMCVKTTFAQLIGQAPLGDAKFYTYSCLPIQTIPGPAAVVQCTSTTPTTSSCATCTAGKCTTAMPGFYLVQDGATSTGQVAACQQQCFTCTSNDKCDSCGVTGYVKDGDNCKCAAGYTPSILASKAVDIKTQYSCVSQALGQHCQAGYAWNAGAVLPNNAGICLDVTSNASCYDVASDTASLKSFWNSAPNPKRACVLASSKQCLTNYAQKQGDANSTYQADLTTNCGACVGSLTLSTSNSADQVCVASSSILAMSIAFLGLLLALVF